MEAGAGPKPSIFSHSWHFGVFYISAHSQEIVGSIYLSFPQRANSSSTTELSHCSQAAIPPACKFQPLYTSTWELSNLFIFLRHLTGAGNPQKDAGQRGAAPGHSHTCVTAEKGEGALRGRPGRPNPDGAGSPAALLLPPALGAGPHQEAQGRGCARKSSEHRGVQVPAGPLIDLTSSPAFRPANARWKMFNFSHTHTYIKAAAARIRISAAEEPASKGHTELAC